MEPSQAAAKLSALAVYRDVAEQQPVMSTVTMLAQAVALKDGPTALLSYSRVFYLLAQAGCDTLGQWLAQALRWSEGPYPTAVARGCCSAVLEQAARHDVDTLAQLAQIPSEVWLEEIRSYLPPEQRDGVEGLPRWSGEAPFSFGTLTQAYREEGAGLLARYPAFVWEDGTLVPVANPDCPTGEQLMGYESHRSRVVENTRALLAGKYVNNVLLYGESGTGKSATVKHLLTLPGMEKLRLIEADKENLSGLPALIRSLDGHPLKFIIFIDDLTFDRDDPTYSVLKTILEGGVERRPQNVAVYATSNRRHLVRQTISERAGDEMDRNETIREKTSLADRFGIRILYEGLRRDEYLALVDQLAAQQGCPLASEELHRRAIAWERHHGSTTPRTALQFVLSL